MSILIKGMGMPRRCAECRFLEGEAMDGLCHASEKWLDDDDYFLWFQYPEGDIDNSKPANCPLIEIPPHGRLIDADKAKKHMDYVCDAGGWLEPVTKAVNEYVKKHIDAEPTIIEAEE